MSFKVLLQLLGGVGILIYGIKILGESLQNLAGDRLRQLIAKLTDTPLRGVMVGTSVTTILQSSSATTVMVVSFVHAGIMTLYQGFGVIMGANVGTTVTAQLMAFKGTDFAMAAIVIGTVLSIAGRNRKQKQIGVGLVGFGLLFVGMQMMGKAMDFLKDKPELFLPFKDNLFLGVMAGTVVTMLVQSSSATVGLTMAMASQGLIPLDVSIAIIFGDNIGTTVTAVLASLGGNRAAKQAAACHVLFNVAGTVVMFPFIGLLAYVVTQFTPDLGRQVADAHTIFNIGNTLIFLPFARPFVRMVQRIVPNDDSVMESGPRYLDPNLIAVSSAAAVNAVRCEMVRMGKLALEMLGTCRKAIVDGDSRAVTEVMEYEKTVNGLNHDIVRYGTELGQRRLSMELSTVLNTFIGGVGDIERIGDHCTNLIEMQEFLQDRGLHFTPYAVGEFEVFHQMVYDAVSMSVDALEQENEAMAKRVLELEDRIDDMERELRIKHIERLSSGECKPGAGVVFIDILSNLERVGDHAHNVALITMDLAKIRRGEKLPHHRNV